MSVYYFEKLDVGMLYTIDKKQSWSVLLYIEMLKCFYRMASIHFVGDFGTTSVWVRVLPLDSFT